MARRKRLPVWRVKWNKRWGWYVDTGDGTVTLRVLSKRETIRYTAEEARAFAKQFGSGVSVRIFGKAGRIQEERTYPRSANPSQERGLMTKRRIGARPARYPDEVRAKALELCRYGLSRREVAGRLGVDATSVSLWARQAGIPAASKGGRPRGKPKTQGHPPEVRRQALAMRRDGYTVQEVAKALGVGRSTVINWGIAAGLADTTGHFNAVERQLAAEPRCPRCQLHLPKDPDDHVCVGIDPHARRYVEPAW